MLLVAFLCGFLYEVDGIESFSVNVISFSLGTHVVTLSPRIIALSFALMNGDKPEIRAAEPELVDVDELSVYRILLSKLGLVQLIAS